MTTTMTLTDDRNNDDADDDGDGDDDDGDGGDDDDDDQQSDGNGAFRCAARRPQAPPRTGDLGSPKVPRGPSKKKRMTSYGGPGLYTYHWAR